MSEIAEGIKKERLKASTSGRVQPSTSKITGERGCRVNPSRR